MAEAKTWEETAYDYEYKSDYYDDWDIHKNYVQTFDAYEAMLIGQVYDQISRSIDGSKITDSYSTTLAKERADRVIAKLPDGETQAIGKADIGKAMFMDILRQKWIYPNANAQHSFLEKLNMWQLYSSVYGYMPMFYDWNVSNSGYVGPDCWLWNPRNLVPQQGRVSIDDMDYVTALTWVGKRYIDGILEEHNESKTEDDRKENGEDEADDEGGWNFNALRLLRTRANQTTDVDFHKDTKTARDRTPQATKKGVCLATRYESGADGEWVTFAPDHGCLEVRRIKNPHKNNRIPFVIKYSQPLFDSFYGLGDFQRAMPLQFARDGLTNFYFKGIKMNLIPPIIANANGVVKHTLDYREGAVMLETLPNSIRRLETSTAGLATYKDAQSNLTGSLLSLYGSQNASLPGAETLNPSQGKTPQAISLYSDKEATRDGAERRHLETAIERLTDGFFSLLVNIGTEDIPMALFAPDIEAIVKQGYADVLKMFKQEGKFKKDATGTALEMTIKPSSLKGIEYRFNIARDSTAKINKDAQRQSLVDAIGMLGKMQNVFQDDPRLIIHWEKMMEAYEGLSDIPGASDWIEFNPDAKKEATPQALSPTAVTTPGGMAIDAADLVKLYTTTPDPQLRAQIAQTLGFKVDPAAQADPVEEAPAPAATPVGPDGLLVHDPEIAAAGERLADPSTDPQLPDPVEPAGNTVTKTGNMFGDPELAQAHDAIAALA